MTTDSTPPERHAEHDMTCREAVSLVTAYLEGALARHEHQRFERHLDECPHCREHLKQIEATILATGRARTDDLDATVQDDLVALYRRWRGDRAPGAPERSAGVRGAGVRAAARTRRGRAGESRRW